MSKIRNIEQYNSAYDRSVSDPQQFWSQIAEHFVWRKRWDRVVDYDFGVPEVKWFEGGELNITENCLDRHLADKGDHTAIIWEPNDPNHPAQYITYSDLYQRVCRMANVLKSRGIKKGDRVCLYLPMVPELAIAVLACARIGAIHSVVFAGFSAGSLAARINDASCKILITADGAHRGGKTIDLSVIAREALENCECVESVLWLDVLGTQMVMGDRDFDLREELQHVSVDCPAVSMSAEDPLFILYTSGSTGKPKGMVHTCGGYMVYTTYTFQTVFQYEEGDVYWCTADIGWITGHSYIVYGPLAAGATTLMFEGVPTFPDAGRFWDVCEKHKVNQFYTAPTAIRALMKQPISYVDRADLSSLRVLGTVGEPINKEAWEWYHINVGKKECPIVDTWWQTETGGFMISPIAGVTPLKPTFAGLPLPGIMPGLYTPEGLEITVEEAEGLLAIRYPWPSMARTIWGDHQRFKETYFSTVPNCYFTGDGACRDSEGYYRITGRVDDVVIVSGHNLGTAPIENAINEHAAVIESAVVGFPHDVKGNALFGFVILNTEDVDVADVFVEVNRLISEIVGPIAKLDKILIVKDLPKTRSGKIMRRILRKIAAREFDSLGDVSTLLNPQSVNAIIQSLDV